MKESESEVLCADSTALVKPRNDIEIAGEPVSFRTEHLPNTSQQRCPWTSLTGRTGTWRPSDWRSLRRRHLRVLMSRRNHVKPGVTADVVSCSTVWLQSADRHAIVLPVERTAWRHGRTAEHTSKLVAACYAISQRSQFRITPTRRFLRSDKRVETASLCVA
jgi:hypothetical protein